jgi:transcription-repair coupling factor (superfamily II helicase)
MATKLGIEKIILKQNKFICYFISDQNSDYYTSKKFQKVIAFVQKNPDLCRLKEKQSPNGLRLLLTFDNVKSINKALDFIKMF